MHGERICVRADNVEDLISEAGAQSWGRTGASVLAVLREQLGPEALETLTPEELIHFGYCQGVGHVIMAIVGDGDQYELTRPTRRRKKSRRKE
jgi:hypothetical protein